MKASRWWRVWYRWLSISLIAFSAVPCPAVCILIWFWLDHSSSLYVLQTFSSLSSAHLLLTFFRSTPPRYISDHITALFWHTMAQSPNSLGLAIQSCLYFICNLPLWFKSYNALHALSTDNFCNRFEPGFRAFGWALPFTCIVFNPLHICVSHSLSQYSPDGTLKLGR